MRSDTDIAWAAGIFEGEGTIGFRQRKCGRAPADLRVCMVDRDVVERFADIVGVGRMALKKKTYDKNHQPQWQLVITGQENITAVLRLFYPYLGERRRAAADQVLAWTKRQNQYT